MTTLKELKEELKLNECADVYIVEDKSSNNTHGWHGDFVNLLDDAEEDREVLDYEEMTPDEMNDTYYANSCTDANDIYEETDKIMFIKVENGIKYENRKELEENPSLRM